MTIKVVKNIYKVLRSVLFTAVIAVAALYISLYIFLSIPPVQNFIRQEAEKQLTILLGGDVTIGKIDIFPFNELRLKNVELFTPSGEKCVEVSTLGAGIHLWRLIFDRKIEITYAEILGLKGEIIQEKKGGPLNINYIIEAFAPKDKNKPPTKFDLRINNVVIRKSSLSFDRAWAPDINDKNGKDENNIIFDPNHIYLSDIKADVTLPRLKNDDFTIDLRRLAFKSYSDFNVDKISVKTHITDKFLDLNNLLIIIGESRFELSDFKLEYQSFKDILESLKNNDNQINISGSNISPKDFSFFYPALKTFSERFDMKLSASGNINSVQNCKFYFKEKGGATEINFTGSIDNILDKNKLGAEIASFKANIPSSFSDRLLTVIRSGNRISEKVSSIITRTGSIDVDLKGLYSAQSGSAFSKGYIATDIGKIDFEVNGTFVKASEIAGNFHLDTNRLDIGGLLANNSLGEVSITANGNITVKNNDLNGDINAIVDYFDYNGHRFNNINIKGEKRNDFISADVSVDDELAKLSLEGELTLAGVNSNVKVVGDVNGVYPAIFGILPKYAGYIATGNIDIEFSGNNIDNLTGFASLNNLSFTNQYGKGFILNKLDLSADNYITAGYDEKVNKSNGYGRRIILSTDFLNASLEGKFKFKDLIPGVQDLLNANISSFIPKSGKNYMSDTNAEINVVLFADKELPDFIHLPIKPLKDVELDGRVNLKEGFLEFNVTAPYCLKGSNKLISHSRLYAVVENGKGASANITSCVPIKNDRADVELNLNAFNDKAHIDLGWSMVNNRSAEGKIGIDGEVIRNLHTGKPDLSLNINPSEFRLGPSVWSVDNSTLLYSDKRISVDGLRIWHDKQFLEIDGVASSDSNDELNVRLADIDLDYIFGILNINYVSFGGIASGEITASSVFTKNPDAKTRRLHVENLAYNDAVLGDAEIFSCWNNGEKEVEIHADIKNEEKGGAKVDGGIFVTRDSLSFDMKADKINVKFLKPFMSAFTSDVGGIASGDIKLFGNFKDIDLTGRAFADSIYMKVDYTNVYYHGSDSVILDPGKIIIPSFTLYDKYGNSANFSGYVKHRYFHDPEFEFKLADAKQLLCYDTNSLINPDWYGRIFASGKGVLRGRPGIVAMEMDMTTDANSDFTFVLSDTQTALDYSFLTFSDKKKEEEMASIVVEETFEDKFLKKKTEEVSNPTIFAMDLRATITPRAKLNLIMDPNAGDKITASGAGPLQIHYDTESDEMTMYGKYTLAEGNYNFSLQDLILREFKIREGSNISFNGDPLAAMIDIIASYRVNTNLSDLDKSFSTDRDLNRTNVPVDALLMVKGDLQNPDISFDISLPTLTSDVERKVRSIISTEDMMNRQIIYLLALNRFYTPEYMGSTSNGGGELASVASSTLSSQLTNIMGQLTDKLTISPSFRSDKGDFSDTEVDVSLSSRLLNNRLLLNGNFGYRDKSTSQTTFVGDFDIEYLLSNNGNLRLKAYNHFNDQNYYLKSSLTTQGLGVVYRKEFDNPFSWLRRKKKEESAVIIKKEEEENDNQKEHE